jgi:GntR family transcriptional regulator, transcriptional repressor for pyruvate dehydrogenase complex
MGRSLERTDTPLVTNAVEAIRGIIAMPAHSPGGRLPSESALAEQIGISRPVLRQALAVLKDEGLIEARRGSGTYSRNKPSSSPQAYGHLESLADLEDCMRFRMVIESAAAELAARHGDDGAVSEIRDAVAKMESGSPRDDALFETDMAFHLAVARAARNRYYAMTLEMLIPHVVLGLKLGRQLRHVPLDAASKRVAGEHDAILRAIESGDGPLAAKRMEEHLSSGIQRVFGNRSW